MSVGFFLDKTHQPTPEAVRAALGTAYPLWIKIIQFINDQYQMTTELSYGGKNYGWNLWYRKSGKVLASLYPQADYFVAQVVLGKEQVEKALALELGEPVGKMVRETPQFHDGKWLFIPVSIETDERDVEQLLLIKKRPVKQSYHGGNA